jgi:hypothetical protein
MIRRRGLLPEKWMDRVRDIEIDHDGVLFQETLLRKKVVGDALKLGRDQTPASH